jgi:DNA-binding HxlR family transcriptional regulator
MSLKATRSTRPIMRLLDLMGRRWTLRILWELHQQPGQTFRSLRERCADISPSVLNTRLTELREARLIAAEDGYTLTAEGRELGCLMMPLYHWAEGHFANEAPSKEG